MGNQGLVGTKVSEPWAFLVAPGKIGGFGGSGSKSLVSTE